MCVCVCFLGPGRGRLKLDHSEREISSSVFLKFEREGGKEVI